MDNLSSINIKLTGRLKITEYLTRNDYMSKTNGRLLLNKKNAINKENANVFITANIIDAYGGSIAYMYFGNGGTTVDSSGNVIFKPPNVDSTDADLYNPTYFQLVDDTLGANNGNLMAVRHINTSLFADADIRCLIQENQIFGQLSSDEISGINLSNDFYFNEIGLKTYYDEMLTHVIFSPILKVANRLLEVVYTIRAAIDPITTFTPPAPF